MRSEPLRPRGGRRPRRRRTSPSSWTATGAGRARAACRRPTAIGAAPRRSAGRSRPARKEGVRYLTLFAFSSENWRRPASEVGELMDLLRVYLRRELNELCRNGVRLRVIGDRAGLPADIRDLIEETEALSRDNQRVIVVMALNYGSRREITEAARRLAARGAGRAARSARRSTRTCSRQHLSTAGHPRPGSADPHQRRAADQQFPALAARLHRARVRARSAGRISPRSICATRCASTTGASGDMALPLARAFDPALRQRVVSGLVLAAGVLRGRLVGGWLFVALVLAAVVIMADEWARLAAPVRPPPPVLTLLTAVVPGARGAGAGRGMRRRPGPGGDAVGAARWRRAWPLAPRGGRPVGSAGGVALCRRAGAGAGLAARRQRRRAARTCCGCCSWSGPPTSAPISSAARVGGPRLAPRISPGKTWSGLCGGVVGASLIGGLAALALGAGFGFAGRWSARCLAVVGQVGDLFEFGAQAAGRASRTAAT